MHMFTAYTCFKTPKIITSLRNRLNLFLALSWADDTTYLNNEHKTLTHQHNLTHTHTHTDTHTHTHTHTHTYRCIVPHEHYSTHSHTNSSVLCLKKNLVFSAGRPGPCADVA